MKKKVEIEKQLCDYCGEDCWQQCSGCGKDVCGRCMEKEGKSFKRSVWASGPGDGFFCWFCLASPPKSILPKLTAYLKIKLLREEGIAFDEYFHKRAKEAEIELAKLK